MLAEGVERFNLAVEIDADQLTGFNLADEVCADDIEGDRFACEYNGIAHAAHYQRADAKRIAARHHAFGRHHNKCKRALHQSKRVHQAVYHCWVATGCNQVDYDFRVRGRLEDRATPHKVATQFARVRDISVMRDRETTACKVGVERLNVS